MRIEIGAFVDIVVGDQRWWLRQTPDSTELLLLNNLEGAWVPARLGLPALPREPTVARIRQYLEAIDFDLIALEQRL